MQIPGFGSSFTSSATRPTGFSATSKSSSSASPGGTAASGNLGGAAQDNSVAQQFLNYAKMSPMERLRANILKSMGLTEDQLKALPPDQQKAVEQKIQQIIQQEMQKNAGKTGQVVNLSA
jgi:hypothetical protein